MIPSHPLEQLRKQLSEPSESYLDPGMYARLSIVEMEGLLHVDFWGSPFDEPFTTLSGILRTPSVADTVASVVLRSPDTGANGTCNWDLSELLGGDSHFPQLQHFSIAQNLPGDHNRKIVGTDYEEGGALGTLLRKAPALDSLIAPSAPDATFFEVSDHPLRYINVDAGFDTQNFISNLAGSASLRNLQSLEWGEYNETYMDTFPQGCTPFDDYRRLFSSPAFGKVRAFTLRNPACTPEEIAILRGLRPRSSGLQFKIVRCTSEYVAS